MYANKMYKVVHAPRTETVTLGVCAAGRRCAGGGWVCIPIPAMMRVASSMYTCNDAGGQLYVYLQ
jgi:hypothetical protein